jgi:hypothetical protein
MHVFTAAFRTRDLVPFVFRKSEDDFEWLVAIFAEKFVSRHDDPPIELRKLILQLLTLGMVARKMTRQEPGADITEIERGEE